MADNQGGPVLVTGATGMVGAALTRQLVAAGRPVRILRRPDSSLELLDEAATIVEHSVGDVTDADSVADAMTDVEEVYHAAALVDVGGASPQRLLEVNAGGTRHVVDCALEAGVRRVVHVSSIAALGRAGPAGLVRDEETEWQPSPHNTAYANSKHAAEMEVQRAVAEGLDAVIVNPALVFGRGRPGEGTMRIVERVASGRASAAPPGATCVVDVEDVAAAMRAAMAQGATGRRYVLCGENLSWMEILTTLADALGRPPPRRVISSTVLRIAGTVAEGIATVTRARPAFTREQARSSSATYRYSGRRAREELGATFRPFADTARRLASLAAEQKR